MTASLRADSSDVRAFVEALAVKLEEAMPGAVSVERRRDGMFGPKRVRRIAVDAGGWRLELRADDGSIQTACSRLSGGIVLKREELTTDEWLRALGEALADAGAQQPDNAAGAGAPAQRIGDTMGFLRRDDDDSQNAPAPQDVATSDAPHAARYESGSLAGIPASGLDRIQRMKQEVARGFFTSDLSVNEFLLVKEAGFEPLGLVLGSSIYHIGFQQAGWNQNQEMGVLTAGDVSRARAGDDAHGGGGRPARRRRDRRRPPGHRPL